MCSASWHSRLTAAALSHGLIAWAVGSTAKRRMLEFGAANSWRIRHFAADRTNRSTFAVRGEMERYSAASRDNPHDPQAPLRQIPPLFAQEDPEDWAAAQSRHLRQPCRGREARACGAVFQATLTFFRHPSVILRWPRSGPRRMRPRRNRNRGYPISELLLVSKSAIADLDAVALRGSLRSHLRVTDL